MKQDKILNVLLIFLIISLCIGWGYLSFINNASPQDIAGIDANNNGIRDDVEEYINLNYGQNSNLKAALTEFARYVQLDILNRDNKELSINYSHEETPVLDCVFNLSQNVKVGGKEAYKDISDKVTNTNVRRAAYRKYNSQLSGQVYEGSSYGCQDVPGIAYEVGTTTEYNLKESGIFLQAYNNPVIGFEIDYPLNWYLQSEDNKNGLVTLASVPKEENVHGIGIPPEGKLWVNIAKGICNNPSSDFVNQAPDLNVSEKTICQNGFQITLGFWNSDNYILAHKDLLNAVVGSFKLKIPIKN